MKYQQLSLLLSCFLLYCTSQLPVARCQEVTFEQEPEDNYFITKKRPATIVCAARHAVDITFTCGGTQIPPTSVEREDTMDTDPEVVRVSISVTRPDITNYKKGVYWCECNAISIDGSVAATSKRGEISLATLRYKFMKNPKATEISQGETLELQCSPPSGFPKPEIFWKKDKRRINMDLDDRLEVTMDGSLIIESVKLEDAGLYHCVAKNPAGKRDSKGAAVTVTELAEAAEPQEEVSKEESSEESRPRSSRQSRQPFFTTEPKALYYIKLNEPLIIDCGARAADIITFRCNGARMDRKKQENSQGKDSEGNDVIIQSQLKLVYNDVLQYHRQNGNKTSYKCQCVGWYQQQGSWKTMLTSEKIGVVKLAYLESEFQREPSNMNVGVNRQARLRCEPPKGQPTPWVFWYKDNERIDPRVNTHYRVSRKGDLIIPNTELTDTGRYKCVAQNTVKQVESRVVEFRVSTDAPAPTTPTTTEATTAKPEQGAGEPVFLQDLPDRTPINREGVAKMTCVIMDVSVVSIDCGGRRLSKEEFEMERETHSSGKMMITISTEVGSGDIASKPDGYFCRCTAWQLKERRQWERYHGNKGYVVESSSPFIEDDFMYPPKSSEVNFEDSAELACEPPKGRPIPEVFWLKDGVRIDPKEDTNFVVLPAGTLMLEYVRAEDQGEYTCVAQNEAGVRQADPVTLTVKGIPTTPPVVDTTTEKMMSSTTPDYDSTTFDYDDSTFDGYIPPFFTQDLEKESYIFGSNSVTLTCTVFAASNLVFACNNETVMSTQGTGTVMTDPQGYSIRQNSLTITADQLEEYMGEEPYSCVCLGLGKDEAGTGYVTVNSQPSIIRKAYLDPQFAKEPASAEVMLGGKINLVCSPPDGVPKPEVFWIKDGFNMKPTDNHIMNMDGSLTINNVMESDAGEYTCAAKNFVTTRTSVSARLTVKADSSMSTTAMPETESSETTEEEVIEITPMPSSDPTQPIDPDGATNTYISKDLHSIYYLIKNKPVTVLCEAHRASDISFNCGGEEMSDRVTRKASLKEMQNADGTIDYVEVMEGSVSIDKADYESYSGYEGYFCICRAHSEMSVVESQRGYFQIAYLRKNFRQEPENKRVNEGDFTSLLCGPPDGNPPPEVSWMKDGEPFAGVNFAPGGTLILESASMEDAGEYVCVAKNVAAKRRSPPVLLEVLPMAVKPTDSTGGKGVDGDQTTYTEDKKDSTMPVTEEETAEPTEPTASLSTEQVVDLEDTTPMYSSPMTDMIVKPGVTMMSEMKECKRIHDKCQMIMSASNDPSSICTRYISCVTNFIEGCTGVFSDDVMQNARMELENARAQCATSGECPDLNKCRYVYYESPSQEIEESGLPLHYFCRDINHFINCADQVLSDCGVTMSSPEEMKSSSLNQISSWFSSYCDRMVLGDESLETCEVMTECSLPVASPAADNSTYWCRLADSLLECTTHSVQSCGLTDLEDDIQDLNMMMVESSCRHDDMSMSSSAMPPKEGGSAGDGDQEGQVDASKTEGDDGNRAGSITASIILLALLQSALALFFSQR